jgi:hypothetical protein
MSPSPTPKRHRGAQPGNHNALRHGLYSKQFTGMAMQSSDENIHADLMVEIALLCLDLARLVSWLETLNGKESPHV